MACATLWTHEAPEVRKNQRTAFAVRFDLMIHQIPLWPGNIDPGAIAAAIRVMVAGRGVNRAGASNIIYGESDSLIPIGNVALTHSTLSIAISGARSCAAGTVAPSASDSCVGDRVMVRIMHSDRNRGGPIASLASACTI